MIIGKNDMIIINDIVYTDRKETRKLFNDFLEKFKKRYFLYYLEKYDYDIEMNIDTDYERYCNFNTTSYEIELKNDKYLEKAVIEVFYIFIKEMIFSKIIINDIVVIYDLDLNKYKVSILHSINDNYSITKK